MDYKVQNLVGKAILLAVFIIVGVFVWIFGINDIVDTNHVHAFLAKLEAKEVSLLLLGHHSIDTKDSIESVVEALHSSVPLSSAPSVRGIMMTINLKSGQKIRCWVMRYLDHPGAAVLDFAYYPGSFRQVEVTADRLVDILDRAGVRLPESKKPTLSKDGTIERAEKLSSRSASEPKSYTLYDITKSEVFDGSQFKFGYIAASVVLTCLTLLYGLIGGREYAKEKQRDLLISRLGASLIFAGLALTFGNMSLIFMQDWQSYHALKDCLQVGKCEMFCGPLTKIHYVYGSHGSIYPDIIAITGREFVFSSKRAAREFYDADSWKDLAVDQLQLGRQACIWYSKPQADIARLDVQ